MTKNIQRTPYSDSHLNFAVITGDLVFYFPLQEWMRVEYTHNTPSGMLYGLNVPSKKPYYFGKEKKDREIVWVRDNQFSIADGTYFREEYTGDGLLQAKLYDVGLDDYLYHPVNVCYTCFSFYTNKGAGADCFGCRDLAFREMSADDQEL